MDTKTTNGTFQERQELTRQMEVAATAEFTELFTDDTELISVNVNVYPNHIEGRVLGLQTLKLGTLLVTYKWDNAVSMWLFDYSQYVTAQIVEKISNVKGA